jgi:hypothetical protein
MRRLVPFNAFDFIIMTAIDGEEARVRRDNES